MAEVADYPLVWHFGDTFSGLSWQWKDSAGATKNITGYTASLKVKTSAGTQVLYLDSSSQGGLSIPTGTDGKVVLNATPAQMASNGTLVEGTSYEYDIQVKSSDGTIVQTFTKGKFRVDKQVTDV